MGTSIVLICAVLASLAVGVVVAYAVCLVLFSVFRVHTKQISAQRKLVALCSAEPRLNAVRTR